MNRNSSSGSLSSMNTSGLFSSPSGSARASHLGRATSGEPAPRSSWLPSVFPVQALEDTLADDFDLKLEPEVAEEVNETSDLDAAAEDRKMPLVFNAARHLEPVCGPAPGEGGQSWRTKERMKTVSVALVICLNVGVDPPDVTKTSPCARMECWIDPTTLNPQKAIEAIGNQLQQQYNRWQPRARYRQSLDPPLEEVRRLATGLRRNARDERVLFHYNGHGVPKPTANGEIWVFNRHYTQYIPLSLYELQAWMGSPSIFVYDCSNAGIIVQAFEQFADQHEREYLEQVNSKGVSSADLPPPISQRNCIQLAACASTQILPMCPELPADLFSSCLTTPIKMALRWFVMQGHGMLATSVSLELLDRIPGQFGDRRTMLGEFNWIFTAITDTIAWNRLPRDLFQKLFRQDMLVASLFRNFLLAERIMRSYDCTPLSQPGLPPTHQHPMWQAWDLAVDSSLAQLQGILEHGKPYRSSTFFEEQLSAFEVWLRHGDESRPPPEQLPIVLQVLLSQAHRLRALDLLGRFLDLGPWAVNLALSVGIFPYVLKLLTSSARELRPLLVSIWAKILAVDPSCQSDLINNNSHNYFLIILQDEMMMPAQRTWAAFILATLVHNFPDGQQKAEKENLISVCLEHLDDREPVLRQWLAVALGRVWDKFEKAKWRGARDNAHERLYELLRDDVPEVRAAAVFALGTFLNSCDERTEHANTLDSSICLHLLNVSAEDGSPLVRRELVLALQYFVYIFEANMVAVARVSLEEEKNAAARLSASSQGNTNASSSDLMNTSMTSSTSSIGSGLRRVSSSASSPALDRLGGGAAGLSGSSGMLNRSTGGSFSSLTQGGVYARVLAGLKMFAADPEPEVATMADSLVIYLGLKAREKERVSSSRIASILETSSVPSSPVRPSFMIGASPPPPPDVSNAAAASVGGGGSPRQPKPQQQHPGGPAVVVNVTATGSPAQQQLQESQGAVPRTATSSRSSPAPTGPASLPPAVNSGGASAGPPVVGPVHPRSRSANPSPNTTLNTTRDLRAPALATDFLPWASKYFTKQLMRHTCTDCDCDRESARHHNKEWLYGRNLEVRSQAEYQRNVLKSRMCKLDEPVTSFKSNFGPRLVHFHPYNAQLAVAGPKTIMIQHLDTRTTLCRINALREKLHMTAQFSSLAYVNAHEHAMLLAASDDGAIRVYKDNENETEEDGTAKVDLVTAWTALPGLIPLRQGGGGISQFQSSSKRQEQQGVPSHMGMCMAWEQKEGLIVVGGDSKMMRLWDANQEMKKKEFASGSDSSFVSALSFSATAGSSTFTAGFGDGTVRVYDARTPGTEVQTYQELRSPILDVQVQDSGGFFGQVVCGSRDGSVRVIDPRKNQVVRSLSLGQEIVALSVHRRAVALAAWTKSQYVTIHSLLANGPQLNVIKNQEGLLGHRPGPVGCLAFHPHLLQLATGPADGNVAVFNLRKTL